MGGDISPRHARADYIFRIDVVVNEL